MFRFLVGLTMFMAFAFPALAQGKGHAALLAKVKHAVSKDFLDPNGATFRNVAFYRTSTGKTGNLVCGEVNAKNAYGAYVGYRGFVYADGMVEIEQQEPSGTYDVLREAICHERLQPLK